MERGTKSSRFWKCTRSARLGSRSCLPRDRSSADESSTTKERAGKSVARCCEKDPVLPETSIRRLQACVRSAWLVSQSIMRPFPGSRAIGRYSVSCAMHDHGLEEMEELTLSYTVHRLSKPFALFWVLSVPGVHWHSPAVSVTSLVTSRVSKSSVVLRTEEGEALTHARRQLCPSRTD
jgi:hypothetical protein